MHIKDLVIEDGIIIQDGYRMYFTLVTDDGEHKMMEWLDRDYKLHRDNSSEMMRPGYTQIKDLLKETGMYVRRLMDGIDAGVSLQRKIGQQLTAARWQSLFLNTRKR